LVAHLLPEIEIEVRAIAATTLRGIRVTTQEAHAEEGDRAESEHGEDDAQDGEHGVELRW
jgi:hypothetical protein